MVIGFGSRIFIWIQQISNLLIWTWKFGCGFRSGIRPHCHPEYRFLDYI